MPSRRIQQDPKPRRESDDQWRSAPRPRDWAARVTAVLARDQACQWVEGNVMCGSTQNLECDHINDNNDHSLSNLRALCRPHHRRRTGQQAAAARDARRIPRRRPDERHPGLRTKSDGPTTQGSDPK